MAHTENSLSRLNKDDLIRLALDYQQKYDITLDKISKELAELCKSFNKLESDLAITKAVNESFRNQIPTLERQFGATLNTPRQKTLEILGIPENIEDGELEGKVLTVLSKLDVHIYPVKVISHIVDLEKHFPDNPLLKDDHIESLILS